MEDHFASVMGTQKRAREEDSHEASSSTGNQKAMRTAAPASASSAASAASGGDGSAAAAAAAAANGEGDGGGGEGSTDNTNLSQEDIQKMLAEADNIDVPSLDAGGIRKMSQNLEKKINKNQLQRAKWTDQPAKFMNSELVLHEEVQKFTSVAAAPELYGHLIKNNAITSLLGLLSHENADISVDAVAVFSELLNPEVLQTEEEEKGATQIVDHMLENDGLELVVENLQRLNEESSEESQGVYNTLALLEYILQLKPDLPGTICAKTPVLEWLLMRVLKKAYDYNKLYASEMLSLLMQSNLDNSSLVGQLGTSGDQSRKLGVTTEGGGVEALLKAVSYYKKQNPKGGEEEECVENLFNCLMTALMVSQNKDRFRRAEGFALMLRCVREKKFAKHSAFRVIDWAVAGSIENSKNLVSEGGLKYLFPIFMGKGQASTKKEFGPDAAHAEQKASINILSSLAEHLPEQSVERLRFVAKFLENSDEKIDRLVELHTEYQEKVTAFENDVSAGRVSLEEGDETDELLADLPVEDRLYLKKLDNGLDMLQRVDAMIAHLCIGTGGDTRIRDRLWSKLYKQGSSLSSVATTLQEHAQHIGRSTDDKSEQQESESNEQRSKLERIVHELIAFSAGDQQNSSENGE